MYHRIAEPEADPWDLAVTSTHFEQQLSVLRGTRHPFPLLKFTDRLAAGTLPSNAVALTFDDGYVDNLVVGRPLLAAADVPATVFLATGFLDRHDAFWWDELASLVMLADAPKAHEVVIGSRPIRFDFNTFHLNTEVGSGGDATMSAEPETERAVVLRQLWEALQRIDDEKRHIAMAELRTIFTLNADQRAKLGRPMTRHEARLIATDRLVTIGAHSVTHPLLSRLPASDCRREIADSKRACEELAGSAITSFSYPYGDFNYASRNMVETAGFRMAVSIREGPVTVASDLLAMPRVHIRDWNGDAFERAIHSTSIVH